MPYFCSRIPPRHHITFSRSCLHRLLWPWYFLIHSLFLMALTILKNTGQILCRMSLNWDLSGVLLMIRHYLSRKTRGKGPLSSHYIKGKYYQHGLSLVMLTLVNWMRQCLVLPPFHSLEGSHFFYLLYILWKEVTMHSPH